MKKAEVSTSLGAFLLPEIIDLILSYLHEGECLKQKWKLLDTVKEYQWLTDEALCVLYRNNRLSIYNMQGEATSSKYIAYTEDERKNFPNYLSYEPALNLDRMIIIEKDIYLTNTSHGNKLLRSDGKRLPAILQQYFYYDLAIVDGKYYALIDHPHYFLVIVSEEGKLLEHWDKKMGWPAFQCMAIADTTLYLVDKDGYRVYMYTLQGKLLRKWKIFPSTYKRGNARFHTTAHRCMKARITIRNDCIYIYNVSQNNLRIFTLQGQYRQKWTIPCQEKIRHECTANVAISPCGRIAFYDERDCEMLIFEHDIE